MAFRTFRKYLRRCSWDGFAQTVCFDKWRSDTAHSKDYCVTNSGTLKAEVHSYPRFHTSACAIERICTAQQKVEMHPSAEGLTGFTWCAISGTRYPDGTPVTGRIGQQIQIVKVDRQGQTVHICMTQGYSATDMTALAICMLVLGCIVVVTMFFAVKKFYVAREVSFVRFRDKG